MQGYVWFSESLSDSRLGDYCLFIAHQKSRTRNCLVLSRNLVSLLHHVEALISNEQFNTKFHIWLQKKKKKTFLIANIHEFMLMDWLPFLAIGSNDLMYAYRLPGVRILWEMSWDNISSGFTAIWDKWQRSQLQILQWSPFITLYFESCYKETIFY